MNLHSAKIARASVTVLRLALGHEEDNVPKRLAKFLKVSESFLYLWLNTEWGLGKQSHSMCHRIQAEPALDL